MKNVVSDCEQFSQCSYCEEVIKLGIRIDEVDNSIMRNEPITGA